jgi:hypothetical protein
MGARAREPSPCLDGRRVTGRGSAAAEGIMTTVIYGDETGALVATVEASDTIKDQLFEAYLAKARWLVNSRWYAIRGMRISPAGAGAQEIRVTLTFLDWDHSGE